MESNNNNNKIIYIFELKNIIIEEEATITKIEGNKTYCVNMFNNKLIFNNISGYCYTDNTTFGAKRYLKK